MVASNTVLIEHEIFDPKKGATKVAVSKLWPVYYISNMQMHLLSTEQIFQSRLRVEGNMSQTSFSLYLHNQWTNFHKLSCAGKPQLRAIRTYVGCTKAITND